MKSIRNCLNSFLFYNILVYVFFWEFKYVSSGVVFISIGFFSLLCIAFRASISVNISSTSFFLIIIVNLIGLLFSGSNFGNSIRWWSTLVVYFLVYLALQTVYISKKNIRLFFLAIPIFFLFGLFAQIVNQPFVSTINRILLPFESVKSNEVMQKWGYFSGFSGNNLITSFYCMILLLVVLYDVFENKRKRIISYLLAIFSFFGVVITQKRGIFIACTVSIFIVLWYTKIRQQSFKKKFTILVSLIMIIIGIVMFIKFTESGQLFFYRFQNGDDLSSGRYYLYTTLMNNPSKFFLFGNGPSATFSTLNINAHNIYLQVFYENGIVGLFLYTVFFISNLRTAFSQISKKKISYYDNWFCYFSIIFQIAFLIYGMVGNPLNDIFIFLVYIISTANIKADI